MEKKQKPSSWKKHHPLFLLIMIPDQGGHGGEHQATLTSKR